jgi:predicted deacetylase
MKKKIHNLWIKILLWIILILFLIILFQYAIRVMTSRQLDDVSPLIPCEDSIIKKSQDFAVIPLFHNVSIADNKTWCEYVLSLNKTLIMHGVYHNYREFYGNITEEEVSKGMEAFKECFGFYPKIFEAPQLAISWENEKMLRNMGLKLRGYPFSITHKVYHCNDTGKYSNAFIDKF